MPTTTPPLDVLRGLNPAHATALPEIPPMPTGIFDDAVDPVPRPRRPRRRAVIAGVVVVAVATAIATPALTGSGPAPAGAAEVLRQVAGVADRHAEALPRPDQFLYVRSTVDGYVLPAEAGSTAPAEPVSSVREAWVSETRPGRLLVTPRGGSTATPTPGNGEPGSLPASRGTMLGSLRLSRAELAAFPTDPPEILRRLVAGVGVRGQTVAQQVFDDVGSALAEQPVPADLRAALYRTLALVPGVTAAGTTTDPDGRRSTSVALQTRGIRYELTFDPDTSELLGRTSTVTDPAAAQTTLPSGAVLNRTVYAERAITDAAERP